MLRNNDEWVDPITNQMKKYFFFYNTTQKIMGGQNAKHECNAFCYMYTMPNNIFLSRVTQIHKFFFDKI